MAMDCSDQEVKKIVFQNSLTRRKESKNYLTAHFLFTCTRSSERLKHYLAELCFLLSFIYIAVSQAVGAFNFLRSFCRDINHRSRTNESARKDSCAPCPPEILNSYETQVQFGMPGERLHRKITA